MERGIEEITHILGKDLTEKFLGVVKKDAFVKWFYNPNPGFDGKSAYQLCKEGKRGEVERVYEDIKSGSTG